jgi:hypothetical protein
MIEVLIHLKNYNKKNSDTCIEIGKKNLDEVHFKWVDRQLHANIQYFILGLIDKISGIGTTN